MSLADFRDTPSFVPLVDTRTEVERLIAHGMLAVCGVQLLVINGGLSLANEIASVTRSVFGCTVDVVVCWQVEGAPHSPDRKIAYSIRPIGKHTNISEIVNRYGGYEFSVPFTSLTELNVLAPFFL